MTINEVLESEWRPLFEQRRSHRAPAATGCQDGEAARGAPASSARYTVSPAEAPCCRCRPFCSLNASLHAAASRGWAWGSGCACLVHWHRPTSAALAALRYPGPAGGRSRRRADLIVWWTRITHQSLPHAASVTALSQPVDASSVDAVHKTGKPDAGS